MSVVPISSQPGRDDSDGATIGDIEDTINDAVRVCKSAGRGRARGSPASLRLAGRACPGKRWLQCPVVRTALPWGAWALCRGEHSHVGSCGQWLSPGKVSSPCAPALRSIITPKPHPHLRRVGVYRQYVCVCVCVWCKGDPPPLTGRQRCYTHLPHSLPLFRAGRATVPLQPPVRRPVFA